MRVDQTVFYTSLRKFCTLTLSYFLFPKPITASHVAGAALLCLGIYLNDKVRHQARHPSRQQLED